MNSVGIDVSKSKNIIAVIRPFGEIIAKPFEVIHTSGEIDSLITYLHTLEGDICIVMEHTGRHYEPVANRLAEAGFFVIAVNPKLIKDYGTNSLRKAKTDKACALKIAHYTLDDWQNLRQYTSMDRLRNQLKVLNRQLTFYRKQNTALKKQSYCAFGYDISRSKHSFQQPSKKQ